MAETGREAGQTGTASFMDDVGGKYGPRLPPSMLAAPRKASELPLKQGSELVARKLRLEQNGKSGEALHKRKIEKVADAMESDSDSDASSGSETSSSASGTSSYTSSDSETVKRRKKAGARRISRTVNASHESPSDSDPEKRSRKSKQKRRKDMLRRKDDKVEKKRRDKKKKRDVSSDSEDTSRSRERGKFRRRDSHDRHVSSNPRHKKRRSDLRKTKNDKEESLKPVSSKLQVTMEEYDQQKALIRRNAELAKARLASGELQRARSEQMEMQRLYGAVDWRVKKKLQSEKKKLERTVAAGNKLAKMEERESARMDAFRVALGLPTAEAQRQAEWRAEATRALNQMEVLGKDVSPSYMAKVGQRSGKHGIIGPRLPPG